MFTDVKADACVTSDSTIASLIQCPQDASDNEDRCLHAFPILDASIVMLVHDDKSNVSRLIKFEMAFRELLLSCEQPCRLRRFIVKEQ